LPIGLFPEPANGGLPVVSVCARPGDRHILLAAARHDDPSSRMIRAGVPPATVQSGTSLVTTDPAATTAPSPIVVPFHTMTLNPSQALSRMVTGAIGTRSQSLRAAAPPAPARNPSRQRVTSPARSLHTVEWES